MRAVIVAVLVLAGCGDEASPGGSEVQPEAEPEETFEGCDFGEAIDSLKDAGVIGDIPCVRDDDGNCFVCIGNNSEGVALPIYHRVAKGVCEWVFYGPVGTNDPDEALAQCASEVD